MIRMDAERLVSRVWGSKVEGKRGWGRPRWSYELQEKEDLAKGGLSRVMALDRVEWKRRVKKITEPL